MTETKPAPWTIQELVERAERALQVDYAGQLNRRIRDLPSLRSIRLYTTLGLLDRPYLQGRTGYYGPRHLMQLVAIKRLQAEGLSLAEIQERLLGQTEETLAKIAKVPPHLLSAEATETKPTNGASRRQTAFWKLLPAVREATTTTERPHAGVRHWQSIELTEGVHLVIESEQPLSAEAVRALQESARPLLRTLQHLRTRRNESDSEVEQ